MLMVIFGAGASYDSFPSVPAPKPGAFPDYNERPPLASQLFERRDRFRDFARQYPKCLPLIAELEPRSGLGVSVEEFLEQYQREADGEARSQLWAIRYYLREVIQFCESQWSGTTRRVLNYSSLFNQVRRSGRVCFITFNYDTLLEQSLEPFDIHFPSMGTYVTDQNCALVKLHGSTDWSYLIPKLTTNIMQNAPTEDQLIRAAPSIDTARALVVKAGETPKETDQEVYFTLPALAIPVVSKSEFVCPKPHIDSLCALLPGVTHIAAIGWRASEKHFLAMLGEQIRKEVTVTAACGDLIQSKETLERIRSAGVSGRFDPIPDTFTDFVRNRRIESFLNSSAL